MMNRKERENDLIEALEFGLNHISQAIGVETEFYDSDAADIACYMNCFKDAGDALKKFNIIFNYDSGEFEQQGVSIANFEQISS